jgi:hypothetical protein
MMAMLGWGDHKMPALYIATTCAGTRVSSSLSRSR